MLNDQEIAELNTLRNTPQDRLSSSDIVRLDELTARENGDTPNSFPEGEEVSEPTETVSPEETVADEPNLEDSPSQPEGVVWEKNSELDQVDTIETPELDNQPEDNKMMTTDNMVA